MVDLLTGNKCNLSFLIIFFWFSIIYIYYLLHRHQRYQYLVLAQIIGKQIDYLEYKPKR